MITPETRKYFPFLFIALVLFPVTILYARILLAPCDDAYILLVYVQNFLKGNGWTYNGTRVEGFSTTLWLVMLTLFGFTRIPLPTLAQMLSVLSGLLCLLATYLLGRKVSLEPQRAVLACCLLAATGDFTFYMGTGLEQVFFTAVVAWCVGLSITENHAALLRSFHFPLALAAMILTRPEGALIAALILLWLAISTRTLLPVIRCGIVLTLMLAPILIAKWLYYGYWLPNTYYVKSHAGLANWGKGKGYVLYAFHRYNVIVWTLFLLLFVSVLQRRFQQIRRVFPLLLISAVWIISVVIQGGDNMVGRRVLLPILPLVYVALVGLAGSVRFHFAAVLTVALCAFLVHSFFSDRPVIKHIEGWRREYVTRMKAGQYLRNHFPPNTLVALNAAGIIPFYSELPTIDMLGLNDPYIAHHGKRDRRLDFAHQAGDGAYVLSRKPHVILFSGSLARLPSPKVIGDMEIWSSKEFHENFEMQKWPGIGFAYVRKYR
ncbi:hypothetical protein L0222_09580 [bacterium]|nr:hypothetical protein [bacterium]MCI0603865.1 hypothetical protein [bacterium]